MNLETKTKLTAPSLIVNDFILNFHDAKALSETFSTKTSSAACLEKVKNSTK